MSLNIDSLKQNLGTPQRSFMFEFEIPAPKGSGSADIYVIRTHAVEEPERSFDDILVNYKGTGGLNIPGRERYSHQFRVRLLESEDAQSFASIQSWMDLIRNSNSGTGVLDQALKSTAVLSRISTADGNVNMRLKINGIYPKMKPSYMHDSDINDIRRDEFVFAFDSFELMSK